MASRTVVCADTTEWIKTQSDLSSVITSLPDAEETSLGIIEWQKWFVRIVEEICKRVKPTGYAIFYQTDRKTKGHIIDKSYLVTKGARLAGVKTIFHKIFLKREVGARNPFRPTYTHLLCFSSKGTPGKATPDVLPAGKMIYKNAMGLTACRFAVEYLKDKGVKTITDPFCGRGSVLAVANKLGLDAVGVDILEEQCDYAKKIKLL